MGMPTKTQAAGREIAIERNPSQVVVSLEGRVIADTREALTLRESWYPPVLYIPLKDVDMSLLERGDCESGSSDMGGRACYSIPLGGKRSANAAWIYEAPLASVAAIRGHIAFNLDRIDAIEEHPISENSRRGFENSDQVVYG